MKLTVADMFAGCGGFSYGFASSPGFRLIGAVDHWNEAAKVYQLNFGDVPFYTADLSSEVVQDDIVGRLQGKVDVLIGGPPCQGFSTLGKRRDDDPRSTLVDTFAQLARAIQPTVVLMENVLGIRTKRHPTKGTYLDSFRSFMEAANPDQPSYLTSCGEVLATDFGLAQTRRRLITLAIRKDTRDGQQTMERFWKAMESLKSRPATLRDVIFDLPFLEHPEQSTDGTQPESLVNAHKPMRHSSALVERLSHIPPGGGLLDVPEDLLTPHLKRMREGAYGSGGHVKNIYGRLEWDKPCGTIVAGMDKITCGRYVHPVAHRLLTPRECARIQGFPDSFLFQGSAVTKYYLIGNAVPARISAVIASALASALDINLARVNQSAA